MAMNKKTKAFRASSPLYHNFNGDTTSGWKSVSILRPDESPRYMSAAIKKGRDGSPTLAIIALYRQGGDKKVFMSAVVSSEEFMRVSFNLIADELGRVAGYTEVQREILRES